jgi:hypothetical protein
LCYQTTFPPRGVTESYESGLGPRLDLFKRYGMHACVDSLLEEMNHYHQRNCFVIAMQIGMMRSDMATTFPHGTVKAAEIGRMAKIREWKFAHTCKDIHQYKENNIKKYGKPNTENIFHIAQHQSHYFVYDKVVPVLKDLDIIDRTWHSTNPGRRPVTVDRCPKSMCSLKMYWLMLQQRDIYF